MGNFEKWSAEGLTVTECDKIALEEAGLVKGGFGFGYSCPEGADLNEEYSSTVVNTQGMGNHGFVVLMGKTTRAKRLLRQGKLNHLVGLGISCKVAVVAVVSHYGMEEEVCRLAESLLSLVKISSFRGRGHKDFQTWSGNLDYKCSFPRALAAVEIAEKVVGVYDWRKRKKTGHSMPA